MSRKTALYRVFDADGALLYVGVGYDPDVRLRQHAATKAWWPEASRHAVTWLESRIAALRAEADAIRTEDPAYNIRRHPYREVVRPKLKGSVAVVSFRAARDALGDRATAAARDGQHTVIERHGRPVAILVPVAWYISKGGDPREPLDELVENKSSKG